MSTDPAPSSRLARRVTVGAAAVVLLAVDAASKAAAEQSLRQGRVIDLGALTLRLVYNPAAAFSLGAGLPGWVVPLVSGLLAAAIAGYAWAAAGRIRPATAVALGAVLGGAVGNLLDRGVDGVVTDFLYTGWFPTFNLADVWIVSGASLLVLTTALTRGRKEPAAAD